VRHHQRLIGTMKPLGDATQCSECCGTEHATRRDIVKAVDPRVAVTRWRREQSDAVDCPLWRVGQVGAVKAEVRRREAWNQRKRSEHSQGSGAKWRADVASLARRHADIHGGY
jgi:hypothetical protein